MRYIIEANGRLYCFFYRDDAIWFCEFKGGVWSETEMLIKGVQGGFSISLIDNEILMFFQNDKKGLVKSKFVDGNVATEILIDSNEVLGRYCAVPCKDGMSLIYNLPLLGDGNYALVSQFLGANGAWGTLRRIDAMRPVAEETFKLIPVADRHFLLFYQIGGFENRLGYKEIYDGEIGKYNLLHSGVNNFGDSSFLATRHALHGAYVTRGMFGSRLMYKKRDTDGISPGIVVADGNAIHNVLLYIVDEKPHLSFMINNSLYRMALKEKDGAQSLLPLDKEDMPHDGHIVKATFLSDSIKEGQFLINELLVDEERPWNIKFLSDYILGSHKKGSPATNEVKGLYTTAISEEEYNSFFAGTENEFLDDDF